MTVIIWYIIWLLPLVNRRAKGDLLLTSFVLLYFSNKFKSTTKNYKCIWSTYLGHMKHDHHAKRLKSLSFKWNWFIDHISLELTKWRFLHLLFRFIKVWMLKSFETKWPISLGSAVKVNFANWCLNKYNKSSINSINPKNQNPYIFLVNSFWFLIVFPMPVSHFFKFKGSIDQQK